MKSNMDIRKLMLENGMTQATLAKILGVTQPEVSMMLKYEMTRKQKQEVREAIKSYTS